MTFCLIATLLAITALLLRASKARAYELEDTRPAVVLAAFGTLRLEALKDLENVEGRVKAAFPEYDVHMAFTCNMIRKIWRQRADAAPVGGPDPIVLRYSRVKNPLSVLADLQETGAGRVLVQSLHVTDGEEYQNLANQIEALSKVEALQPSLRPFQDLRLGPPALGLGDGHPAYLDRAAEALKSWIREASEAEAALVLMGHGNEKLKQAVFDKLQARLRRDYPRVYLGTVEAEPGGGEIAEAVAGDKPPSGRVIMAPLMVVAGDHARKDMAGEEPDSWKSLLSAKGLKVEVKLVGLGSLDSWADIYVESLKRLAAG
ncbi:MAG: sirohydrochlorin cobaltochelatase [Deltaproteobacteria bacterium]|jgi:sirohydrochlorin cobaltochelatase|nr:sirohydrochlorin cobaltochelatase [Deltaproteobacteria bacterium]